MDLLSYFTMGWPPTLINILLGGLVSLSVGILLGVLLMPTGRQPLLVAKLFINTVSFLPLMSFYSVLILTVIGTLYQVRLLGDLSEEFIDEPKSVRDKILAKSARVDYYNMVAAMQFGFCSVMATLHVNGTDFASLLYLVCILFYLANLKFYLTSGASEKLKFVMMLGKLLYSKGNKNV